MNYEIKKASDKMFIENDSPIGKQKYPWDKLQLTESFTVNKSEVQLNSLLVLASTTGIKQGKRFRVISHDNHYEVGFVSWREEGPRTKKPKNNVGKVEQSEEEIEKPYVNPDFQYMEEWTKDLTGDSDLPSADKIEDSEVRQSYVNYLVKDKYKPREIANRIAMCLFLGWKK